MGCLSCNFYVSQKDSFKRSYGQTSKGNPMTKKQQKQTRATTSHHHGHKNSTRDHLTSTLDPPKNSFMAKKRKNAVKANQSDATKGSNGSKTKVTTTKTPSVGGGKWRSSCPGASFEGFPLYLVPNQPLSKSSSLAELHPSTVWTVPNFLSQAECSKWIDFCETSGGFEYTAHPASSFIAHRECYRMQQSNAIELSRILYLRLVGLLPRLQRELTPLFPKNLRYVPVGFNPNIRLYKYIKGHSFGKHVDGSNEVDDMGQTEITVLVYLSSCKGGATRFYPVPGRTKKSFAFDPEPGTMLLHVHGDNCLEHEAEEVLGGTKYVLRTDIVFATR